eukprot:gene17356-19090_t
MPPKKKDGPSKKSQEKAKERVIEDKTFGLKNKKGKKQQQFIKTVTHQVKHGGNPSARKLEQLKEQEKQLKKDSKQSKLDELNQLFRPVQTQQKVSAGADPKSVLCAFFKQGLCTKGNKCKFSHDLSLERKGEKKSVYIDERKDEKDSGMDNWSQDQLEEVVKKKHEEAEKKKPKTSIICKYFLEAIDKSLYGWFWSCPNGEKCIYKHALPKGFVLKRKEVAKPIGDEISLEELIENERQNLGSDLTPVTLDTFLVWKKKKLQEKKASREKEVNKKKEDFERGKSIGKVSGRELFLFKPELADDDDEEAADDPNLYKREVEEDDTGVIEISTEALASIAQQADGSGTKATSLSANKTQDSHDKNENTSLDEKPSGRPAADLNGAEQACAAKVVENDSNDQILLDGIPVEESLFEDDVDDLELDELEIVD